MLLRSRVTSRGAIAAETPHMLLDTLKTVPHNPIDLPLICSTGIVSNESEELHFSHVQVWRWWAVMLQG